MPCRKYQQTPIGGQNSHPHQEVMRNTVFYPHLAVRRQQHFFPVIKSVKE
jgi:hypothetical protein